MRNLAVILVFAMMLGACNRQPVACTAESAQAPVVEIIKDQLEKEVTRKLRNEASDGSVGLSKIRAAIAQLEITLDDIRTSKEDPNSTKRFCTGTLAIKFPTDVLDDADKAREAVDMSSVSDLAANADVDRAADKFSSDIDFNVQPTDDGKKVFAETESGGAMIGFAAEVLASGLLRSAVEEGQAAQQQAADQQTAQQNAALQEQRDANLNAAKIENQLAAQTIGAVWKAIPAATRSRLLPLQRAWIRKKDADCRVEAAAASTDATEMEVARLHCDSRMTQERLASLQSYRGEEPVAADEGEFRAGNDMD